MCKNHPLLCPLILIGIVLLCGACHNLAAQSNIRFQNYSTRDGLAAEQVEHIIQDTLGFMWISYNGGISRFDGYNFKVYQFEAEDSLKSPFDKETWDIISTDHNGQLWGCRWSFAERGLQDVVFFEYDYQFDGFKRHYVQFPHSNINPYRTFNSFGLDPDDETIWITTIGGGLYRYSLESGDIQNYKNDHPDSAMNVHNNWFRQPDVRDSIIVLPSARGLWIFDKKTEKFSRPKCDPADSAILLQSNLGSWTIESAHEGFTWLMDMNGIWYQITDDFRITKRLTFNHPDLTSMTNIEEDTEGNFWFATLEKGLLKYEVASGEWINISEGNTPHSLQTNRLTYLYRDRDQNIWIGTQEEGVSVLRKRSINFSNHNINGFGNVLLYSHNGKDQVVTVSRNATSGDSPNEVLKGLLPENGVGEIHWEKVKLRVPISGEIQQISRGKHRIWFSSFNGIIGLGTDPLTGEPIGTSMIHLTAVNGNQNTISTNLVTAVYEDSQERLWASLYGGGMTRINSIVDYGNAGSVTRYTHAEGGRDGVRTDYIYRVHPLDSGTLLIYTLEGAYYFQGENFHKINHGGAVRKLFKSRTGQIFLGALDGLYALEGNSLSGHFKKKRLVRGAVMEMIEDKHGRLWLTNLEGIICYDPTKNTVLLFDKREGIDHTHGIMFQSLKGNVVTANIEGISIFNPETLVVDERETFPALTGLRINNKVPRIAGYPGVKDDFTVESDITVLKELKLDYQHNNFTLEFSAMEMTAPEKNLYRHKLEGYDDDWIETDHKNRTATYTNLDAGTYTFRVMASNHHGVWSDNERTLTVTILPPPWKTAWAYAGYTLIVIGLLFTARRMIVQRERLKGSLKLAKVEQEKEHFQLEKALEVDRVKTSFFTNISHEFRTPLTLIKGPVETLLDRFKDDADAVQRLKLVQRNSDLLLRLINQLLDLARIESGTMKIEKSQSDIHSFIRAIASSFESLARQKDVSLFVNVSHDQHQALFDRDKLETILINLINNAIKFTPSGGSVHVQAGIVDNALTISVRDTGIGIPAEHQEKIFERFHQVSEAHQQVGTGIGLSLVQELVKLLNGNISVISEPGKGTTFTVVLQIEAALDAPDQAEAEEIKMVHEYSDNGFHASSNNGGSERPHVLVVEDNNDLRAFIIDSLGNEFHFLEADNGRKGLEIATTDIPDLIISDIMMPEMDGITMASKIKSDQRSSHIPLILLTAKSTEDSKLQGLTSGADDYLTKPFNKQELLLKIRNATTRQRKLREKVMAEMMSDAPRKEVLSADEQFLMKVKEEILNQLSNEQLSVESLAEQIGMSRVHLYRKISALTGMSVNELIRKLRLHRAAQLLEQNWGPVSQVAYEVGFSNLSYFSKVFKEEFGKLPSNYAEKC